MTTLHSDILENLKEQENHPGDEIVRQAVMTTKRKYDFNEYGGAPLLGVKGICMICHGASEVRGIKNAIGQAKSFSRHHVNERITGLMADDRRH
jgi:glycerol-3-phosphate acyltransferase PlsX